MILESDGLRTVGPVKRIRLGFEPQLAINFTGDSSMVERSMAQVINLSLARFILVKSRKTRIRILLSQPFCFTTILHFVT